MKKILIENRIIKTEEAPLDDNDLQQIKTKWKKQMKICVPVLIAFIIVLLYTAINGMGAISARKAAGIHSLKFNEEREATYYAVLPYVLGFCLFLLIAYSIYYYITMLAPISRDMKSNKKLLLHFIPEKTEMGIFNKYYLSTPVVKKQQVQVTKEDFDCVPLGDHMIAEVTYCSHTLLQFTCKGKIIDVPDYNF